MFVVFSTAQWQPKHTGEGSSGLAEFSVMIYI